MAQAKASMWGKAALRRLFGTRNIIIISEKKIDHVAISMKWQFAAIGVLAGLVAWGGYCTGNYRAAQTALQEKERRIETAQEEKTRLDRAYALLKHDIAKIGNAKKTQGDDYAEYVMAQYGKNHPDEQPTTIGLVEGKDPSTERVAFLEKQLELAKKQNEQFIQTLRQRTAGKIGEYEDILDMTGLDSGKLKRVAAIQDEKKPAKDNGASKKRFANQGGPFIPADFTANPDDQAKLNSDIDKLLKLNKLINSLPLFSPMGHSGISSTFGHRTDPINGRTAMHTGIDFTDPVGTAVRAANNGKVIYAGNKGAYGNVVEIDHGYGVVTRYAHLLKVLVQNGQSVKKGDRIAQLGNTGRTTGPHLHYEVRYHDQPYNPARFLEAGQHVLQAKR